MRFANVRLERYGPFEGLDLPFDPAAGRVNLIVAPNGFGKSVIRRAIGDFLFGIDARTQMNFRFGNERMFLKAAVIQDGTTTALVRRKGNGNTLAIAGGAEFSPDATKRLLGGASETVFHELFGLDTTLLRSGGRELIRSQGRLGQVLFAAGGGMGRVRDLLSELEHKRDELGRASVRHRSRPLWSALSAWEQGNMDLRRVALRPDGFSALERQAEETAGHLAALLAEQSGATGERDRLLMIRACRPWLDRLAAARLTLIDTEDAPQLSESFEQRWREAIGNRATTARSVADATADLQAAQDARARLSFDPAWIAAETDILALADLRGQAIGAERDLPNVARALDADRAAAAALRRDLGWDVSVALPATPVVRDAQRRLQQQPKLALDAAAAQDRLAEAERQLVATTAALEALPAAADIAAVIDLAALLRARGNPATLLDTARRKLREADAALRAALNAIPDCPLAEAALSATAAPSEGRLEAAGKALSDAETAQTTALRDHAGQQRAIAAERGKLATLERNAALPPPDALAGARARRDALWAQFHTGIASPADAVAFDRAIRDADGIADAMIAHGQEVADARTMRVRLATLEAEHAAHEETVVRTAAAVAEARDDLVLMARTAGSNAADIATLRSFLRARAAAIACRDTRDAAAADLADTEQTLGALGRRLAAVMNADPPDLAALPALLAEADRRIDADKTLAAQRASLTDQAAKQRTGLGAATAAAVRADRALADWTAAWGPVAAALQRPADEPIASTTHALALIEELRATEQREADNQRRVDDMRAAIALLTEKVAALAVLSPDDAALAPVRAAEAFQRRLQAERSEAARCLDADRRIEQAAEKLTLAEREADSVTRTLIGLRAALRATTDEQAELQLQRGRTAAAAHATAAEALRELAIQGGGLSVDSLTARASETTADADTARIAAIDTAQQQRTQDIDAARAARDAAATALEQVGTGLDAAEAAQRREAARAMLARTAEEALILHASHALLQAALDRQAEGAHQPLLARIGEVFRIITGGAQAGVRIEDSRDGQTMVALEADGVSRKSLDQLSEGTCDQLYLALRIAALEDYARTTSPLPFIADDILQTFDDPRTEATMRALLGLSEHVQVIVLTHHTHIGDLAARLPAGAVQVMRLAA
jgi:uncharacterized protein YhaN